MIVGFSGKVAVAVAGLQDRLRQFDTGRYTVLVHLPNGDTFVLFDTGALVPEPVLLDCDLGLDNTVPRRVPQEDNTNRRSKIAQKYLIINAKVHYLS